MVPIVRVVLCTYMYIRIPPEFIRIRYYRDVLPPFCFFLIFRDTHIYRDNDDDDDDQFPLIRAEQKLNCRYPRLRYSLPPRSDVYPSSSSSSSSRILASRILGVAWQQQTARQPQTSLILTGAMFYVYYIMYITLCFLVIGYQTHTSARNSCLKKCWGMVS